MKALPLIAALALSFTGGAVLAAQTSPQPDTTNPSTEATPPAPAAPPAAPPAERPNGARFAAIQGACSADFKALCPGLVPGDGKLGACLRENRAKLSPACGDALQALRAQRRAAPSQ